MKQKLLASFFVFFAFSRAYCGHISMVLPEFSTAASTGISGACSAKTADINSISNNPAALYGVSNFQAMFTYNNNTLTGSSSTLSTVVLPAKEDGDFALSYVFDRQSGVADSPYSGSGLSRYNYITSLSYAFSASENIKLGVTAKYINSVIVKNSASYLAFDAGAVFMGDGGLSGSVSVMNIGDRFDDSDTQSLLAKETLPLKFGAGFNFDILNDNVNAISVSGGGFYHANETKFDAAVGLEYMYQNMIIIRAGNKVDIQGSDFVSAGAGFNYDFNGLNTRFDYGVSSKLSGPGVNGASSLISILIFF